MRMNKTLILFVFLCVVLAIAVLVSLLSEPAEAPAPEFKGPTGQPFVKGPTEQPPGSMN